METKKTQITDRQKEYCAVTIMRRMLEKYSQKEGVTFEEAMYKFSQSAIYDALFDYGTDIWKNGPDYLLGIFEESFDTPRPKGRGFSVQ